ncbi:UNVERIFIED_CONTAM: ma3 domain-containing translation regulatory factor 1 [Sesamum calycinum]|uniref:Ma3 domain-containing translation regulatory factor 1 n=1 Tax=Sesamum calycinum TaxID=2727403 RepID=A0AAW2PR54_9LAMI
MAENFLFLSENASQNATTLVHYQDLENASRSLLGFEVLQTAENSYLSTPHHAELVEREKEIASVILSALHMEIFPAENIVDAFVMLLESAEDTTLDILDAPNELAYFLARAVMEDALAPLNLAEIANRLPPNCSGSETVHMAQLL